MESSMQTHSIGTRDDFEHVTCNTQGLSLLPVHGGHFETKGDHAKVASFVAVAVLTVSTIYKNLSSRYCALDSPWYTAVPCRHLD